MVHSKSWSPKDPDEVINYELPWGDELQTGDTIATSEWPPELIDGVVLDATTISDDDLSTYARVSGGVDGTTATLINRVTTANGETLELLVLLPIVATEAVALGEYETPRPRDLVARYPAFHAVPYDTIQIYINDALTVVDTTWLAADYPLAIIAFAAHNMTLIGLGEMSQAQQHARGGVSSIRDGAFSVSFNDKCVQGLNDGSLKSTVYGQTYRNLLRRNKAGPRVIGSPVVDAGWGPLAQQNNGVILP